MATPLRTLQIDQPIHCGRRRCITDAADVMAMVLSPRRRLQPLLASSLPLLLLDDVTVGRNICGDTEIACGIIILVSIGAYFMQIRALIQCITPMINRDSREIP